MINLILNAIITAGLIFSAFNYAPLEKIEWVKDSTKVGATIVTINGSDTLSSSRTVINNNFSALNNGKIENASTSLSSVTTLSNLVSIGTITTGVWTGTTIAVANGGTGSTTLSSNQVLLGNGTTQLKTVAGYGSSGQFLTSNGAATAPSWQTSAVDQAINYNWSGNHNFTGSTTIRDLSASSTVAFPLKLNGLSYSFPATHGASSTALVTNGSGSLIWGTPTPARYAYATNTAMTVTGGAVVSSFLVIPANTMTASSTIIVDAQASQCLAPGGGAASCTIEIEDGSGTNFGSAVIGFTTDVSQDSKYGTLHAVIYNNSSVSSQSGVITSFCVDPVTDRGKNSGCAGGTVSSSINTAAQTTIAIRLIANSGTVATLDRYSIIVTP